MTWRALTYLIKLFISRFFSPSFWVDVLVSNFGVFSRPATRRWWNLRSLVPLSYDLTIIAFLPANLP